MPDRISNFIGSQKYLDQISNAINEKNKKIIILSSLFGGSGGIANQFGYQFKSNGYVYWIRSDLDFKEFANDIGIQSKDGYNIAIEIKRRLAKIKNFKILFILDNFDNDKTKNEFIIELSCLSNVYFLITTKSSDKIKEIYSESESISLDELTFNKTETKEFIKVNLSKSMNNELESNQITESSPYVLNKMIAYKKLNNNSNLFDYKQDDLFNHLLIKNKTMWEFLQICSFFNSDYIPIKHTFVTILEIDQKIINTLIGKLLNLSLIKVQIEKSSNGLKLNKRLKEEIKEFSKRKDTKNYTKLLDYCSEKIKKFKLTNFQSKNVYLNLKSFLNTIAENYQITNNRSELFKWYFDFGVYSYELNIFNDSLDYYQKALININDDEYVSADVLLRIGQLFEQLGSYKQALEYFIKSLEIYEKSNDLSIIVKLYDKIGKMYKNESEYTKALEYYNLSLNLISNHLDIIKTYNNISFIYRKKGQFQLALEYYTKSLNIISLESINDDSLVASLYNNIGSIYALKNEYDKSLEYFQKSLEIRKQILKPNHLDILGLYNNIGLIYQINDDFDKALDYYGLDLKISLESSLSLNHARIIELYEKIGEIYKHKGDHYKALDYFKQSLNLKEETLSNNLDICKSYIKIGSIYNDKFNYDKALEYFSKSLDIQKQSFNADIAAETYCNLGVIYRSKCENKKAVEFFMKSLNARKKSVHSDHPEIKHLIDYNNYIILLLFFTNIKVPNISITNQSRESVEMT